ncbi:zinc metalloprotease C [Streptococcus mitis]|uniref:zinc metalloprotease C n=6 Tax=Streptococcus mitis TaxID=28037 RepID=UPI001D174FBD|nr:ZmpA/ZmpB/ZmpC family metallo-endopeptidase [Streptococcus mitis]
MSRKNIGEKRQSFSMRKLSVGLVSVTVASFFLMSQGIQSVSADHMESPIHYKYMTEGELTDEEKSLLVEALPQLAEESDDTYYLVYRPQQFLPNTGFNPTVGTFLFTAGLSLLVLLVSKRENGKKRLVHFLLLTSMGVQLLPASAFGLTSQILSAYNSQFAIGVGEQLPEPLKIEGYQYIGYIKTKKQDNAGISRTVDGKYSARSDSQPDSTKTSDVVHSADLEWNKGQGKLSLQGETSGDDGLSEKSSIAAENLSSNDSLASQGEQNPGHKGESVVRPTLPEQGNPVSATTVQSAEEEVLATTNDRPEYKLPLETKGTQESGHEGEAAVREETPEYTKPLATKGTQESGHEGEAVVQPELPEYTDPVSTKGTQEPGHEGEATAQPELPEYKVSEEKKGTQEPGHEGEAAVQPELPEYTDPVSTKGTQEPGHEGEATVREESPAYTEPLATKGTQESGHEGEAAVREETPEYTKPVATKGTQESGHEGVAVVREESPAYTEPLATKGTQEPGHEGEAAVQPELPEYKVSEEKKGTQEPGHEGEEAVQPELPEYTDPVATKGTQEPGHEGEAAVREESPAYTEPLATKGTQEPDHEGEAAVREESPAYTEPLATKGTQEPGHEGEAAVREESPAYTEPLATKGTQEPDHEGEATVREESPAYTEPLATKGTQEPGHEGEAAVREESPAYTEPLATKGTQEPGHEGEAVVQPELPEYTDPVATKGTQEPGHEGEATVREESPAYTEPLATKGTQEPGHEGEAAVREESPAYTEPLATKGTQEPGHEGEAVVREESPAYTDPLETKGTQEPGHEGEAAVREEEPVYTEPLATKGTQEPGHEGEAVVQPELPEYTDPVATKGTQEPGHEGEAAVQPELPEYTDPVATKGTQEPGHEGEAAVREETPEYTKPLETKGTQEPGHEGEAAVTEELPALEVTTRNRTETENIPYTTEEIQDPTLLKNRRETERQGQAGTRTIQYEDYIVDGNVVETKELSRTEVPPVKQIVKVGTLVKVKPTVEIANLTKAENKKSITVSYNLTDSTSAYVSAKAQIFQGDQLIKEVDIENPAKKQVISGLNYYTPYTLKTRLTYNLGENDEQSTETSTQAFQLDYKKIEIKDIDSVELYGKENDRYRRYLSLSEAPTDTAKYFVKVKSDRFKEMYLPVKSITENTDGTYKVTAAVDQLVEEGTEGYKDDYTFNVAKSKAEQPGVYTSFKQLVTAMKSNLAGVYKLAADMSADEVGLPENQTSYITGEFTGTLVGAEGSKAYAIYDLKKPLFDTLKNATVKDLDLKNTQVDSKENAAAVAKTANNANISNVAVEGKVSGRKSVAGLVVDATNTRIENSSFSGKLVANHADNNANYAGGIVGKLTGGNAKVDKSKVDAVISTAARNNNQTAGGIVGKLESGALVTRSVTTGKILNGQGYPRVGGIVGSTYPRGRVDNVVSNMIVGDGYATTGDQFGSADVKNVITSVENKKQDNFVRKVSKEEVEAKIASYGITVTLDDTGQDLKANSKEIDYTTLSKAQAERRVAYNNIEKLMPFYNKELVVHYGNKVAPTDKLYTTELLDVVPMNGNEVVTDINNKKNSINRVMLHYKDNTVGYLDVTFKENFANSQVVEYNVADKGYIFTPEAFVSDYTAITNNVLSDLQNVTFSSEATKKVLGAADDAALDNLYLDREFEEVKANIGEHLRKVLAMDKSINTTGDGVVEYVSEKIKHNKEAFMLGLTYMNRWYNINYDSLNTKDLSVYKFDFNGNNEASTLDTIIALGNSGLENLRGPNTTGLYASELAPLKGEDSVFDFVEAYRKLFLPNKTNNQWLKDNTKAYIVEAKSDIAEVREKQESPTADKKYSIGVYDRISAPSWGYKSMLLPLLTMKEESLYAISTLSTLAFGSYERYRDRGADGAILSGDALKQYVRGKVDQSAKWQRDHYDIWYKVLAPEFKERLYRAVPVTDAFEVKDTNGRGYWATLSDKNIDSIYSFFGPAGKYHTPRKNAGAYATGVEAYFVSDRLLDQYGTSVYSHEMVHNSDGRVYFEGNERREGLGAELYALGLLQSADSVDKDAIVLNTIFKGDKDSRTRLHTYDPTARFTSEEEIQHYLHGMYDVLYTLDAMEAKAVLIQSDTVKKQWFRKIENYYVRDDRYNKDTHAGNKVRPLTDEEVARLTTLDSLIENDIINRRAYQNEAQYGRNGYYTISMFSPIYAGLSNPNGAPGDVMFRKTAFELYAEKGYHKGFLPYVSNQYGADALAEGSKTYSSWYKRDVALVTDSLVLRKVFDNHYTNWVDFKKDMFNQRINKQANLKPITIQYELDKPNSTKEVTISSAQEMQALIDAAVAHDVKNLKRATENVPSSWVHLLKQKIYNAYLRSTDDFRESIYK